MTEKQNVFDVKRAVSSNFLQSLEFGQPILLFSFISPPKEKKELKIKTGKAKILGYFTLDGISHNLQENKIEELNEILDVEKINGKPYSIFRACGFYSVGSVVLIKDSLGELIEKFTKYSPITSTKTDTL